MNIETSYSSQLLMTAYSLSAILYTIRENKSATATFYRKATFETLTETLSDYMAEIGANEDIATKQLAQLCKELDVTDVKYIAWITEKWKSAMAVFMESERIGITGTFLLNEQEITLVYAFMKDNTLIIEYLNNETGELLSTPLRDLDEQIAINVCKQYETATGIDCNYRNI